MWEIIAGMALVLPYIILQIMKIRVNPEKKWDILSIGVAIIGVLIISFGG